MAGLFKWGAFYFILIALLLLLKNKANRSYMNSIVYLNGGNGRYEYSVLNLMSKTDNYVWLNVIESQEFPGATLLRMSRGAFKTHNSVLSNWPNHHISCAKICDKVGPLPVCRIIVRCELLLRSIKAYNCMPDGGLH